MQIININKSKTAAFTGSNTIRYELFPPCSILSIPSFGLSDVFISLLSVVNLFINDLAMETDIFRPIAFPAPAYPHPPFCLLF